MWLLAANQKPHLGERGGSQATLDVCGGGLFSLRGGPQATQEGSSLTPSLHMRSWKVYVLMMFVGFVISRERFTGLWIKENSWFFN
jgi:hypothetical protein